MAEEVLDPKNCDDLSKADIFSLGLTMYSLTLGEELPSDGGSDEWKALRNGSAPGRLDGTGLHCIVVDSMMHADYHKRPSAWELLKRMDEPVNELENQSASDNLRTPQTSSAKTLKTSSAKIPLAEKDMDMDVTAAKTEAKADVAKNSGSLIGTKGLFNGFNYVVTSFDEGENLVGITIALANGEELRRTVSRNVLLFPVGTEVLYNGESHVVSKQMNKMVGLDGGKNVKPSSLVLDS